MLKIFTIILVLTSCIIPAKAQGQKIDKQELHALLIVGRQEDGTQDAINKMNKIATLFTENGIAVHTFYDKEAEWDEIKKVAPNCSFLVYAGHGSTLGPNGNAGGICINSNVTTKTLVEELKLKENALVLFQSVCRGAGSSADDNDDIGINEAEKRVYNYGSPFFEIGASAYYANNYVNGCRDFLEDFLAGMPLKEAYDKSASSWTEIEFEKEFDKDTSKLFSIASRDGGGFSTRTTYTNGKKTVEKIPTAKGYKIAYIGSANFNISRMSTQE